jgi:hypothetical protein
VLVDVRMFAHHGRGGTLGASSGAPSRRAAIPATSSDHFAHAFSRALRPLSSADRRHQVGGGEEGRNGNEDEEEGGCLDEREDRERRWGVSTIGYSR